MRKIKFLATRLINELRKSISGSITNLSEPLYTASTHPLPAMSSSTTSLTLISSLPNLSVFLSSITPSTTLYLDFEGRDLSRNGTLTIITALVYPTNATSLIDIQTLGASAFTTSSVTGKTFKAILEDPLIPKCFWDVRNDADALWSHYHVRLAGVTDIQLLENASRKDDKTYLHGLATCIRRDVQVRNMVKRHWANTKKEVTALMDNDVFSCRPLDDKMMQYCANDVVHLPALRETYSKRLNSQWTRMVKDESARRVADACSPAYEPQSDTKKFGPWGPARDKKRAKKLNVYDNDMEYDMYDSDNDFISYNNYDDEDDDDDYY
ncbi:ribonuclease H-like domain-containing protein [Daldinia caldariorum]|uniref:ribonuclease H-like domain-containing protein n=1 Tax=Daldinia caldariorum TaxID=326644 RepID=UPI002007C6C1|nr:ribonuclease H-like domain-containing protein [Daldinia caldariorum]KAI1463614.1 ribonuclease H-like domain-containing protein [Daldinia caldariorum]